MKTLNYLSFIFVLALLTACNGQKTGENTDPVKKEEVKKDPFSELNELKLPIKFEAPEATNAVQKMKATGLDILSQSNSKPKRTYFKTPDGIQVEIEGIDNGGSFELTFSVLDQDAKKVGELISVTYYQSIAGANYITALAKSAVIIENNKIIVETNENISRPAPDTNLENPEMIEEKTDSKKNYKIIKGNIIEA